MRTVKWSIGTLIIRMVTLITITPQFSLLRFRNTTSHSIFQEFIVCTPGELCAKKTEEDRVKNLKF